MALTQVSSGGVEDGTILNADLNASAAIAGTKISPSFGSQNISTTGTTSIGGSTSVGTKLHIENASGDAHIRLRGSANYGVLFTRHSDAALTGYVGSGNAVNLGGSNVAVSASLSGGDIIFQTNGTAATDEKMRIKSNGAISFTSQNATGWQLNAGDDSASYSAIDNHFPTTNRTLYFNAETTHRSVAFWNKNGSDGYGFGLDNSGNFKVVAGTTAHLKVTGSNGLVGIGTTAPSELLTINGADKSALIRTSNAVGTAKLKFEADGTNYAGIGLENTSLVFRCSNSSTPTTRFIIFADGSITSSGDIRVDRGTTAIDGILGQAYSGYFGLKHADQTINQEYMIISADSHTFISASNGAGIYIRPDANSEAHQTFFNTNDTTFKTNVFMDSHYITRNSWEYGFLVGAQNNLGASDQYTNPIFSIGTSHLPTSTALSDMYGIGYSHGNASFNPSGAGWGMYVAADGEARVYLDGSYGNIYFGGNLASVTRHISSVTGDYGSMQINNGGKNGWSGYSIDGHSVFMSNGSASGDYIGLYDDNANSWVILSQRLSYTRLHHAGLSRLETTSAGVYITGTLTASSTKSFRISHPLSELSETKDLVHAAIEGPQMDLMYRGKVDLVNGTATVNIDTKSGMTEGTFDVLNRDVQCFTTNETGWTNVKGSVTGNKLTIVAEDNSCTDTISWMVIGERKDNGVVSSEVTDDNGDLIVEPDKQVFEAEPKMDD